MSSLKRHIICIALLLFSLAGIHAQDISEQNRQKKALEKEIELINRQLSANRSQRETDLGTLQLTRQKIKARKSLISGMDAKIAGYERRIRRKGSEITSLDARLDTLMFYYSTLVYNAYKNRDTKIWFMYLMGSRNISQAARRWSYLKDLSANLHRQAYEIEKTKSELEKQKSDLTALMKKADTERANRTKEYEKLAQEEEQLNRSISELASQEKKIRKELEKKRKEVERLNKEIERLIAQSVGTEEKPEEGIADDETLTNQFLSDKGRISWPVDGGIIIEPYGQNEHPVFKNIKLPFNNGINISCEEGSSALAVFDGVVKQILLIPGYNQCILVRHGRFFTFYCKLKKATVKPGDIVRKGKVLGIIDPADNGTSVIHFELWDGTQKQNPELWLSRH